MPITITEICQDRFTGPALGLGGVLRDNGEALSDVYNLHSASSALSAQGKPAVVYKHSTESLILAQDERWRRA